MNLKKAIDALGELYKTASAFRPESRSLVTFNELQVILEALAEPDEGEVGLDTFIIGGNDYQCSFKTIDDEKWIRWNDILNRWGSKEPATPAFAFGDLVEDNVGERAIFLRYLSDPKECWVLEVDSTGDFIGVARLVKHLKLIQRGFCDVSLGKIRDKLKKA